MMRIHSNDKRRWQFSLVFWFAILAMSRFGQAAEHVVVIVCDGLRPDLVTKEDMPTLDALRARGVDFARHHPVYLSSTEVNGTALATGAHPRTSGVVANHEYRPDIDLLRDVETQSEYAVWRRDVVRKTPYLHVDTVAEILRAAGKRTVVAGTKPVALLWDRGRRSADSSSVDLYEGKSSPSAALDRITDTLGPLPPLANPKKSANYEQDRWTSEALTTTLWKNGVPAFSVLWMSEPDFAQHGAGPGTAVGRAALRGCDRNIKAVLGALEQKGERETTDVFVVSDHGFSTVSRQVDVVEELKSSKLSLAREFEDSASVAGKVMAVTNGGSVIFYVPDHDASIAQKLVKALQDSNFAGVIFARQQIAGTFRLAEVRLDADEAPDVVVSLRWGDERWRPGLPKGTLLCDGKYVPGQGHHASLSRYDMHNTLIACGPDFRKGYRSELPSGNIDLTPTVLKVLGLEEKISKSMDGRILIEALASADGAQGEHPSAPQTRTLVVEEGQWRQMLRVTEYDGRRYIEEGNRLDDAAGGTAAAASEKAQSP